jgi:hypothetical protein
MAVLVEKKEASCLCIKRTARPHSSAPRRATFSLQNGIFIAAARSYIEGAGGRSGGSGYSKN